MTNDELLAIVKDLNKLIRKQMKAIDAVVELHKPEHSIRGYRCTFDDEMFPCKNIQAIEKEI